MSKFDVKVNDETLIVTFDGVAAGWEQWLLITSDRHWDSKHTDRSLQRKHLEQAVERDALILDLGDLFDAMQGRWDKRGGKSELDDLFAGSDYFDLLLDGAEEFFRPFAEQFLLLGTGNHETSILRHHEINLTWQLGRRLRAASKSHIHLGKYSGYVRFQFKSPGARTYRNPILFYYHHGSGGAAEVTRGVIKTNRRAVYLPDADVVVSGHTHQSWYVPIVRERVTAAGRVYQDTQHHVSVPSYKSSSQRAGWAAEKGMAPTPVGAIWCRLWYFDNGVKPEFTWAT